MKKDARILMATITSCQGIKGLVRLKNYASSAEALLDYRLFTTEDGKQLELIRLFNQNNKLFAQFKGIDSRNEAEALKNTNLYIARTQLTIPLEEDEFYYVDLIGLEVYTPEDVILGSVKAIFDFGASPFLEVQPVEGKSFFAPFNKISVPTISLEKGFIILDAAAIGLELPTRG